MPSGEPRRVYQFAVGDASKSNTSQHSKDDATMAYVDELQFTGTVNYTSDKSRTSSDDTTFEVYNLTPEMRKNFMVNGSAVMLRAGYDDNWVRDANGDVVKNYDEIPVIFVGSVVYAYTEKNGVDEVTTLHCSNDRIERAIVETSTSYAPGTKREAVIRDLVKQMNLPVIDVDTTPCKDIIYESGLSVFGRVSDELTRICDENGLVWYTHNKQIRVVPKESAPKSLAWEIHPYDIIDSIEGYYHRTQSKPKPPSAAKHPRGYKKKATSATPLPEDVTVTTDSSGIKTKVKEGLKLKVHLDGRIKLGDNVKLVDCGEDYDGQYEVIRMHHQMDFRGGQWLTELEITDVGE